jgi:hypothetical protein
VSGCEHRDISVHSQLCILANQMGICCRPFYKYIAIYFVFIKLFKKSRTALYYWSYKTRKVNYAMRWPLKLTSDFAATSITADRILVGLTRLKYFQLESHHRYLNGMDSIVHLRMIVHLRYSEWHFGLVLPVDYLNQEEKADL